MISFIISCKQIYDKFVKDEVTVYAAQASFFTVISAFPFIMLLLAVIQLVPAVNKSDLMILLVSIMPDILDSLILNIIDDVYTGSAATILSIAAVAALWSASKGMLGISRGLNRIFESTERRNYFIDRTICAGYTIVFIFMCIISLLLLVFGSTIQHFILWLFPFLSTVTKYIINLRTLFALAIFVSAFTMLYTYVPKKKQTIKQQLPGAVFSTICWIAFSFVFSIYFNNFHRFSYMYGSLTAVVLLMLWLYICICILFLGAEINYHLSKYF